MTTASRLIQQARARARVSQAELARRADIPRSVLNVYERGHRDPGTEALAAILSAAGFELELNRVLDLQHNADTLSEVLDLAESLPWKPRKRLRYPAFGIR